MADDLSFDPSGSNFGGDPGGGFAGGSSSPFGSISGGTAALGIGALGLGSILAKGESPLPAQFQQMEAGVPYLRQTGADLVGSGQALQQQGGQTVAMGARGELTDPQKAQLSQFSTGLTNKSRQMFANMGRNPDADTAAITQQANDDAQVNAMAQEQIRTTLATGFGQITAGTGEIGQGLQFNQAADKILYEAAQAQIAQDKAYGDSLTSAFSSIATMFAKAAPMMLA